MAALQTAPVDVLVTDIHLPGASGGDLAAKALEVRPGIAIVYATGDATSVKVGPGIVALPKPYDRTQLTAAIAATTASRFALFSAATQMRPLVSA